MIVAIDGPAASGKGTIARAVAHFFGLPHLDTGLLYRCVGLAVLRAGESPSDPVAAVRACDFSDGMLADPALRSEAAGSAASIVSALPAVREALTARQRAFADQPGGAVLDGRDIATVIAPHADAKLFVTASINARAARRLQELRATDPALTLRSVLTDLATRDARDARRAIAPLKPADQATVLDTSALTAEQAIAAAIAEIRRQVADAAGRPG